jgi:hypothetical protein
MDVNQKMDQITLDFLKRACYIAKGDTEKSIEIMRIWHDLKINDLSEEYPLEIIVTIVDCLKKQNFIEEGETYDQIRVTYDGIYYIINTPGEVPTSYGVVSIEEMKRLYSAVLQFIYERTRHDNTNNVSLTEINYEKLKPYGRTVVHQIAHFLRQQDFIELFIDIDNSEVTTKIAPKGIAEIEGTG